MWVRTSLLVLGCFAPLAQLATAQNAVGQPGGLLEIRLVEDSPGPDLIEAELQGSDEKLYLHRISVIAPEDIVKSEVVIDSNGEPAISIDFTDTGAEKMAFVTKSYQGKRLALVLDGQVISAPKVVATISSKAQISGNFDEAEAKRIAEALHGHEVNSPLSTTSVLPAWVSLFNGRDLTGWVNVNTAPDTWTVKDGLMICSGQPIGVMRSEKQYENFVLHIEWRHMKPGGNSGVFVWSEGFVPEGTRLPKGMEVQMLERDWVNLHPKSNGDPNHIGYISGELFGAGGLNAIADNPRGRRSMAWELRCNGAGEWNAYDVVCVDGTVKLSINGRFVNSIRNSDVRKGYLCLESEGSEIHFRNIQILELPPGVTSKKQVARIVHSP
jgi:hypothetical protein